MIELKLKTSAADEDYRRKASEEIATRLGDIRAIREALDDGAKIESLDPWLRDEILALDPNTIRVSFATMEDGSIFAAFE